MAARALADLRRLLDSHGSSLDCVDVAHLDRLETHFMNTARGLFKARLVGVPRGLECEWRRYTSVYCRYLAASDRIRAPCTVFVSMDGASDLQVCLLRRCANGRIRLI
jgi:hypothetical protein